MTNRDHYKKTLLRIAMVALLLPLMQISCGKAKEEVAPELVRPVKTLTLVGGGSEAVRQYPGKVDATQTGHMAFQAAGKVIELPIQRGQQVKKGELLARIDPRDFESAVAEAKASVIESKADWHRYRKLYEDDAVSLADLQVKEQEYKVDEANLQTAEKALEDTVLRAPFDGVVAKKFINNFQNVAASDEAVRIQDNSKIEILIDVPERDVAAGKSVRDRVDVKATATFDAIPDRVFDVSLLEWETQADDTTQTFRVKFGMPQPEDVTVMPGMTANISLDISSKEKLTGAEFVIPSIAVFSDAQGNPNVWIVQEDMRVTLRRIEVGELTGTKAVQIKSGLNPGETIALSGVRNLREGMRIKKLQG